MAESAIDLYNLAKQQLADKNAGNPFYAFSGGVQKGIDQSMADQDKLRQLKMANELELQQAQAKFEQQRKQVDMLNATQTTAKPIVNTILGRATRNVDNPTYASTKVIAPSKTTKPNGMMSLITGGVGDVNGNPLPVGNGFGDTNASPTIDMLNAARTQAIQSQPLTFTNHQQVQPQAQDPRYSMELSGGNWQTKDNQDEVRKLQEASAKEGVNPYNPDGTPKVRTQILSELAMAKNAKNTNDNLTANNLPYLQANAAPEEKQAFLGQLPQGIAGVVKGLADYNLDITKVSSIRGDQRLKLAELVKQYDPTFDMNQYAARKNFINNLSNGALSKSIVSANTLIGHIAGLQKSYEDLHNGSIPLLNAVGNMGKAATGSGALTKLKTNADAVANELESLFRNSGGSLSGVEEWRKNISDNASPEQAKAFIDKALELMSSRLGAIDSQYQNVMGKPREFSVLNNKSKQVLQKMNINPSEIEGLSSVNDQTQGGQQGQYQAGETRVIQGVTYTRDSNGNWHSGN